MEIIKKIPEKGFYYHYKHDPKGDMNNYSYEYVGVALHSEERNYTVIYRPLYENDFLAPATHVVRPLDMWMGMVEKDGKTFPRFTKITDSKTIEELQKIKLEMYGE